MDKATKLFRATIDSLEDADFIAPSALPVWTRAHVVAHVHFNAKGLMRLLHWAHTGEPTPMYASAEQRAAELERGAALAPARLRELVHHSALDLALTIDILPTDAWRNEVVTAQGRTVPAKEVLWMRTREVAVHAVDLDKGVTFADLPDDLNTALAIDVVGWRAAKNESAMLAAWLTGRMRQAPVLQPWL